MTTIDQVINRPPSQPTSTKSSSNLAAVEAFMSDFPTAAVIADFFTAKNWPIALEYASQMLTRQSIPIAALDEAYHTDGLALQIVKAQFVGLHQISASREPAPKSADLAAQMFVGKYGQACTPYDVMVYFAHYPIEYKTTFAMYDVQDILAQYAKKYVVWKRNQRQERQEPQEQQGTNDDAMTIAELLMAWISEGRTIEQIKQGGLYHYGMITDGMIKEAQKQLTSQEPF